MAWPYLLVATASQYKGEVCERTNLVMIDCWYLSRPPTACWELGNIPPEKQVQTPDWSRSVVDVGACKGALWEMHQEKPPELTVNNLL